MPKQESIQKPNASTSRGCTNGNDVLQMPLLQELSPNVSVRKKFRKMAEFLICLFVWFLGFNAFDVLYMINTGDALSDVVIKFSIIGFICCGLIVSLNRLLDRIFDV